MSSPRNPSIPRLAPEGTITLVAALDIFGSAIDPAWTGKEIQADTAPEPSEENLANRAFARVTREASDNPRGEIDDQNLPERAIVAALRARCDIEFAERRRWKAAAIALLRHLHQGRLKPVAMGGDGMVYEVPTHLWAAMDADTLFDTGGCLEVRTGRLAVPTRPIMAEDSAIVLVNRNELQRLTVILNGDSSPTVTTAEGQQVEKGRTGLPGRPTISHLLEEELRQRAEAGECESTLRAEAEALIAWGLKMYPDAPRVSTRGLENRIRDLYSALVRPTK